MGGLVFLLDVDNTLLDNDLVRVRLEEGLREVLSPIEAARFWETYERVRVETDVVNFPETLEHFGGECTDVQLVSSVSSVLYGFPFSECVYPDTFAVIQHLKSLGTAVILSDGDQMFQRHKIRSAGLEAAVDGNVLVYVHKEHNTSEILKRFPADRYVMVDDKARIHAAMRAALGQRVVTVMVCQGHYAQDPAHHEYPEPDVTVEGIGGLRSLSAVDFATAGSAGA